MIKYLKQSIVLADDSNNLRKNFLKHPLKMELKLHEKKIKEGTVLRVYYCKAIEELREYKQKINGKIVNESDKQFEAHIKDAGLIITAIEFNKDPELSDEIFCTEADFAYYKEHGALEEYENC